jgi:hypothetical protein
MGVLDTIKADLAGPTGPVTETIVPTALPPPGKSAGVLEKISAQLQKREDLAAFSQGPEKIMMPDLTQPLPPNEISRRPQDFVGPRKPRTDAEIDKMNPKPALGYGAAGALDAVANTFEDIRLAFTEKGNPMIGAMAQQYREQGVAGILNSITEAVPMLPVGLGGFVGGTASWVSATSRRILAGENVGDAIINGEAEGMEFSEKLSSIFRQDNPSPMAQGIVGVVPAPFSSFSALLDHAAAQVTSDPKAQAAVRLLGNLALLGGGERAIKYFEGVAASKGRIVFDAKALTDLATSGSKDPQVALVAQSAAQRIDPLVKVDKAMADITAKMADGQLMRTELEMRMPRMVGELDDPVQRGRWSVVLKAEMEKRGMAPIVRPGEGGVQYTGPELGEIYGIQNPLDRPAKKPVRFDPKNLPEGIEARPVPRVDEQGKPVLDKDGNQYIDTQYWKKVKGLTYDKDGNPVRKTVDTQVIATPEEKARLHRQGQESRIPASLREVNPHTEGGYVVVPGPIGHPNLRTNGSITESRLVYEKSRGRTLGPEEVVHHKDLTKTNNNEENLFAFRNQKAHRDYHASQAAMELADQIRQEGLDKPNEFTWYIEDTADGEFMPAGRSSTTAEPAITDTQVLYKIYADNRGGLQAEKWGSAVDPKTIERATKGAISAEGVEAVPAGNAPSQAHVQLVSEVSKLVNEPPGGPHQYGWSFHPEHGDSQTGWTKGKYIVSKWPDRGEIYQGTKPTDAQIQQFVEKNADLLSDKRNFVGGWQAENGDFHMDISTTEATLAAAEFAGKAYDQKAAGFDHPTEGFQEVPTGGTGRRWTPEETAAAGWPHPTERNAPLTGPAPSGDPAVALLEGIQKIGLTTQTPEAGKSFRQRAEGWVTDLLDRFYPIHKYSKQAGKLLPGENPSLMVKAGALSGMTGKAEKKIFQGGFDTDIYGMNKPNGQPALNEIYKPFRDDMPGFDKYLISRAALEEEALNRFRKPADWVNTGVDLADAKAYVDANAAKYDAAAKQYTKYFHSLLDELSNSGLLDPEVKYEWRSKRPEYAPLRRDLDSLAQSLEDGGNKGIKQTLDRVSSPVRARLGSDKPILPPSQSAIIMTYEITAAVERQKVAKAIVDLRDKFGMDTVINEIFPGPAGDPPTGRDIVMVRDAGKSHWYKVPEDLADSMKMIHESGLAPWVKKLSVPSRWLRTGATSAPGFAVRNPVRDWQTAFVNSKSGFNPITDFTKGLWSLITKDKDYWDWKGSGAEWSMLVTLDKSMAEQALREMKAETTTGFEAFKAKWIKSPLAYLEMLSEAGEKPTRIGVYKRNQRAGLSDMEAAAESRSASTDFATRGAKTKEAAALYTFLNARAQTTYKLAQTAMEHPGQFVIRGLASAALPTLLLYAINRDDPEYWKRDKKERAMFWFLPIKIGGRQVKLPKGELGIIFGTGIEMALEAMDSNAETRPKVTEYLDSLFQTVSPVGNVGEMAPTFARPGIEWVTNTKYYSGTPIENETDKSVAPYLRSGPYTSETAKAVGQAMGAFNGGAGVSPKKIENALYGYTGGVGRMAVGLIDWLAGKAGILPQNEKPKEPMSGTPLRPIVQGFLSQRAAGFESEPARMFYAAAEDVEMTKKTLENLVKQGPGKREGEIKAWIENHPYEMELLKISNRKNASGNPSNLFMQGREELANLRKAEQKIGSDQTMSAEDKRKALDMIDKRVSAIVDPVWKLLNAVSSQKKTSPGPSAR